MPATRVAAIGRAKHAAIRSPPFSITVVVSAI
jgi:hypothetical protein